MTYVSMFYVQDNFLAYFLCGEHRINVVINTHTKKMVARAIFLQFLGTKMPLRKAHVARQRQNVAPGVSRGACSRL